MITIVSLGVGKDGISLKALRALRGADEVLVRSASPASEVLKEEGISFRTLDFVYEKSRNFDTLAKNLAREVKSAAEGKDLCYCVEGGISEDRAAQILRKDKSVAVIEGVSKAAKAAAEAGLCGAYQAVSAYEIAERKLALPLVVYDLDDELLAGDVKLYLSEKFGDEASAFYSDGGAGKKIRLYEADRQKAYGPLATLVVYNMPLLEKKRFDFDDFVEILRRLRAPNGCPWDRAQTHESIRINAIEEAYELVDAIDSGDSDKLREESGDVLMQAAFHALMEEEKGAFTVGDMLTELCEKLITRHTHVFGKDKVDGADSALSVWDKNKMTEKHQATYSDAVNDVPQCFPALLRAQKICKRVEKGGWDKPSVERFETEFRQEYEELLQAFRIGNGAEISEELGDVLMCVVSLGRAVGADCEMSLLDTVKKVQKRYTAFEKLVLADGKDPTKLTSEESLRYYKKAKDAARD